MTRYKQIIILSTELLVENDYILIYNKTYGCMKYFYEIMMRNIASEL